MSRTVRAERFATLLDAMPKARRALLETFWSRLDDITARALRSAVVLAEKRRLDLYLVGGAVRDLLLGAEHLDIDLMVEGDAIALAGALARDLAARAVTHPRFGTAAVRGDGLELDFACARSERYERPGALPTVRPARLEDDLARRDFTINAMALRLTGDGDLLDPHGGDRDLKRRLVRVLHDGSFRDDATRIPRAVRYAARLGFEIEGGTESLLRRDLGLLDTISGARLRRELERMAHEERVGDALRLASELGVLEAIHPALRAGERVLVAAAYLGELALSHRDAVLFCLLLADASPVEAEGAIARLHLTGRQSEAVRSLFVLRAREADLAALSLRPSAAVGVLEGHPLPSIEALALLASRRVVAERARRYLDEWRHVRPRLNGRDVEALGVAHGPKVGEALAALCVARLDGLVPAREDEEAFVTERYAARPLARARHG